MSSSQLQRAVENPTLDLKIVSASDISHIGATDKIDIYAVVSINGDTTQQKQVVKTPIDYDGGSNPTWNHTVKFSINEIEANEGLLIIKVKLYSYWLEGDDDLYLGEVNVSVQELLASNPIPSFGNANVNKMKLMTCPVNVVEGGSTKATLSLLYRFKPVPALECSLPTIGQPVFLNPDPAKSSGQSVVCSPRFQTASNKLVLELVIKFARDIENVNVFSAMDVYASIAILKDRKVKDRINTPIAVSADTNPKWNHKVKFSLDEKLGQEGRLILLVELMSHRPFLGDKEIGFSRIPIQQLLASNPPNYLMNGDANGMKLETHALTGPYGKRGIVSFTYRFLTDQVTASTVPPPTTTTPHSFIRYLPVSPHSYSSSRGTSGYVTVQPGANDGSCNGLVPIYMTSQYQSHGHQQYSPPHTNSQFQPQPQPQSPLKSLPQKPFPPSQIEYTGTINPEY